MSLLLTRWVLTTAVLAGWSPQGLFDEATDAWRTGELVRGDLAIARVREESAAELEPMESLLVLRHAAELAQQHWRYELAHQLYEALQARVRAELEPDHLLLADVLADQAQLEKARDKFKAAERLAREALRLREARWGPRSPRLVSALQVLALVKEDQGHDEEALSLAQRAVALSRLGGDWQATATALNNLGAVMQWRERLSDAEGCYRDALELYRQHDATATPGAASTENNLAVTLWKINSHGGVLDAVNHFKAALAASITSLGPRHPFTAHLHESLASAYVATGRDALGLLERERAKEARTQPALCLSDLPRSGCAQACSATHGCSVPSQTCVDLGQGGGCFTACTGPLDCERGNACIPVTHQAMGVCVPAWSPAPPPGHP